VDQLINAVAEYTLLAILMSLLAVGFAPEHALRLIVRLYPKIDPRRREVVAELYVMKRLERPVWVFEQIEPALLGGLSARWYGRSRGVHRQAYRLSAIGLTVLIVTAGVGTYLSTRAPTCGADERCVIIGAAFAPDTSKLTDEAAARATISTFLASIPLGPPRRISITGYSAAIGSAAAARSLSFERAQVFAHLLTDAGVDASQLDIAGAGFEQRADPSRPAQDSGQRAIILAIQPS
jgi:hypothetical protein